MSGQLGDDIIFHKSVKNIGTCPHKTQKNYLLAFIIFIHNCSSRYFRLDSQESNREKLTSKSAVEHDI